MQLDRVSLTMTLKSRAEGGHVPGPRDYTTGTDAALVHYSGGLCYWPGCPEPVIQEREERMFLVGQRTHIRAAFPNGPRYDPTMSDDERRDFVNLILLCIPRHSQVDRIHPERYPIEILLRWKTQREAAPREALERLREVTPSGLRTIVAEGLQEHDARMLDVIGRLEQNDGEAAGLMRSLIDELTESYARQREGLDSDVVNEFYTAARQISGMRDTLEEFTAAVEIYRRHPPRFGEDYE
jgi:hypothetical protein